MWAEVTGSGTLDALVMVRAVQTMRECGRKDRVRNRVLKVSTFWGVGGDSELVAARDRIVNKRRRHL